MVTTGDSTMALLQACHAMRDPHHGALAQEVARINGGKEWATEELIALSIKFGPGSLSRNRYDSPVHYSARDAVLLPTSVLAAAPTAALRAYLSMPGNAALRWLAASDRTFSYLAIDFDARVYKIYLFNTAAPAYLGDLDVRVRFDAARPDSYIDLLEIDMDDPARHATPMYFKLRGSFDDFLQPGYRPHPAMEPRLLHGNPRRGDIVDCIRALTARLGAVCDPVIKCRPPASADGALYDSDYAVSVNTFDSTHMKYLNDHRRELRVLAECFDCAGQAGAWLDAVAPFDCFISYVCVGPGFVTLYYKSTTLVRRMPGHFMRD